MCPRFAQFTAEVGPPAPAPSVLGGHRLRLELTFTLHELEKAVWIRGQVNRANLSSSLRAICSYSTVVNWLPALTSLPMADAFTRQSNWTRAPQVHFIPDLSGRFLALVGRLLAAVHKMLD